MLQISPVSMQHQMLATLSSYPAGFCRSTDLFPFVESDATGGAVLQFVRAANSDRWTPETLQRLERAAAAHAKTVKLHLLPHAGHWLHVDNPQGLINVMAPVMAQVKVP